MITLAVVHVLLASITGTYPPFKLNVYCEMTSDGMALRIACVPSTEAQLHQCLGGGWTRVSFISGSTYVVTLEESRFIDHANLTSRYHASLVAYCF
jgi:hypothetical protein